MDNHNLNSHNFLQIS